MEVLCKLSHFLLSHLSYLLNPELIFILLCVHNFTLSVLFPFSPVGVRLGLQQLRSGGIRIDNESTNSSESYKLFKY